ncbi:MAG: hypothetical protein II784_07080 [Oscillospiraceae bacterium]|nr:hypothetical protein [Oscillospiraceae bacterium]
MELKNFDQMLEMIPKSDGPRRVVLAGSDGENTLKGIFAAQEAGFAQPVLVGDRARTIAELEKLGLENKPYTMVDTMPGQDIAAAAINVIRCGEGDILMRGNMLARDFLIPVVDSKNGLRDGKRIMSHVCIASMDCYPKLLALADMAVIIRPDMSKKRAIIQNTVEALNVLGYEKPKLALLALIERGTFHMQDTVDAQSLEYQHRRRPLADCEIWGPISYDLIMSKDAAARKRYHCDWTGGGFDAIIAPEVTTANTLVKSWMVHTDPQICGAVMGAKVPIAFTSRASSERNAFLSIAYCTILEKYRKR